MTAIATPRTAHRPLSGFTDILRAEFCKLRSVPATTWTLAAAVAFNIGLAALAAIFIPGHLSGQEKATADATRLSLAGLHLSQIAVGVLGVLVITSEYDSGMIRASLSAVPRRRLLLAAKAIVFAVTAFIVGTVACFAAYFVFQAFLSDSSLHSSIGDPGVFRALIGGGLYLAVFGLLGLGLGAIVRRSAGAIATLLGLLFVPQILVQLLPQAWKDTVGPYVPMQAGGSIYSARPEAGALGPWAGFGVFCLYAVVALGVGFFLINRRDA
ncbi:MAG: ABC transporter permease subunit [Dehalococcoidia bacterium]